MSEVSILIKDDEKMWKDFAAYRWLYPNAPLWIKRDDDTTENGTFTFESSPHIHPSSTENIKLIVRPLKDMTDAEALDLFQFLDGEEEETTQAWRVRQYYLEGNNFYTPQEFYYLLTKQFDLYKLIEQKIAIDATTVLYYKEWIKRIA